MKSIQEMTPIERADFCGTHINSGLLEAILDEPFKNWLLTNGFFSAPASTKYHLNYEGGLCQHSLNVMDVLVDFNLSWMRPESPFIVGMFHDLCKCDMYKYLDGQWCYNENQLLKGHGDKSVILLSQFKVLTEEEILCIRYHMGAYEKEAWDQYDMAIKKYPNVLWTHHADMIASKLIEV